MTENLQVSSRISKLKEKVLTQPRYASIEQALIITESYKDNEDKSRILQRALALKSALCRIKINADPSELIVGNRTAGVRYGVVFPESGSTWVDREFETLPTRPQDKFLVVPQDIKTFREVIKPYWAGKSMEDRIQMDYGIEIAAIEKVVKINQKDHAQGHICPNSTEWLIKGPAGLAEEAKIHLKATQDPEQIDFYQSVIEVMEGAQIFMLRYYDLLMSFIHKEADNKKKEEIRKVAKICKALSSRPASTFHEAVQSVWFLFVILHMESNASSFSPGRMDQFLYPYYQHDIENKSMNDAQALEIIESLWLKFNEIVYMRNAKSAKYFAGFPIGFNIALGGVNDQGDAENELTFLFLKAQEHLGLPQPNLSVRLHKNTSDRLLKESIRVVAKGSGMPQFFNDEAVIPALIELGISPHDATDYAIVGCVELTTQGNNLGWSDAAMFNMNKALEVTLTGGIDLLTGEKIASDYGDLTRYETFAQLESAFSRQLDEYMDKMILACEHVEKAHMELVPTPFLSAVIDDCMSKGMDVTRGGAHYNLSGIQMIQIANLADSLAAIKQLVYDEKRISKEELLAALTHNFEGYEIVRSLLMNKVPKYGNDVDWVDQLGVKWANYFKHRLSTFTNYRGGRYHTGMYTVSAHVPMGENVGASADGRFAGSPLADGGMSPAYGRDIAGPTAVLKSVAKLDRNLTTNGGLLNMKFLPKFFESEKGIDTFGRFLRAFVDLEIPHIQFNVVNKEDLIAAQADPDSYRSLTIRVAGYTAYFTELADELQSEIIARTSYGDV